MRFDFKGKFDPLIDHYTKYFPFIAIGSWKQLGAVE